MENILEITDQTYSAFIEDTKAVVFIDFYSNTCGPCQTLLLYLPNLAQHYKNDEVVIAKVNVAQNPKLSNKFMVKSVPLCVVIGKDKMVKKAELGLLGIENYFKMIDNEIKKEKGFFSRLFA